MQIKHRKMTRCVQIALGLGDIAQRSRQKKSIKEQLAPIRKKNRCQIFFLGALE